MLRALPPKALGSNTVTWKPRSASSCAAVKPPTPPPSTATPVFTLPTARGAARAGTALSKPIVPAPTPAVRRKARREIGLPVTWPTVGSTQVGVSPGARPGFSRLGVERRGRDLNPRGASTAPNRLAGDHLRPLGHLSKA